MKAYHFLKDNMCGGYGNEPAWKEGETRRIESELKMCERGYHASPSWYDALLYAQGNIACIVEIKDYIKGDDKYVAHQRTLIKARNAEKVLRTWACDCSERALKRTRVTDERCWNAIKVARLFNISKATKEELADARDAAWAAWATWDAWAAWAAAWDAEIKWQKRHLNKLMKELFEENN